MHVAIERARGGRDGAWQGTVRQERTILLERANRGGEGQGGVPRQLHVAGRGNLLQVIARWRSKLALGRARDDGQVGIREGRRIIVVLEPGAQVAQANTRVAAGPGGARFERIGDVVERLSELRGLCEEAGAGEARALMFLMAKLPE